MNNLSSAVTMDPRSWCEVFGLFHKKRIQTRLADGVDMATDAASTAYMPIVERLSQAIESLSGRKLVDFYRELNELEQEVKAALDATKGQADDLLKNERNLLYNPNKAVFSQLAQLLDSLQQEEEEVDEDAEFDVDEVEEALTTTLGNTQKAVNAYLACVRTLGRYKYNKKSLPKNSRAAKIRDWLGDRVPADDVLHQIGRSIVFQNGLRRFVNASKRYVFDVPSSYRLFRKAHLDDPRYYQEAPTNAFQLSATELDAIILMMLRNARELLSQTFVARNLESPRFESLRNLSRLFRNQIMVDEATDFSPLQLACMEGLTAIKTRSFFACGDFNQRITSIGLRAMDQVDWVSEKISAEHISTVYRQSRALNAFAGNMLEMMDGDRSAHGNVPEESTHDGVQPVLREHAGEIGQAAAWLAQRIIEVERAVNQMPTIAVLVNSENEVKPVAEALTLHLESINLRAEPCEEGKALGEGTDVRVFDIQHIKGLEFEAVFFVGVDQLAENIPELFERYLYVGATRAATYLGMVCYDALPAKMQSLRAEFIENWQG